MDIFDLIIPKNPLPTSLVVNHPFMDGLITLDKIYLSPKGKICGENDRYFCVLDVDYEGKKKKYFVLTCITHEELKEINYCLKDL